MSSQNTRFRIKDRSASNASSTLLKADVIVRNNAASGVIRSGEFTVNATSGLSVNTTVLQVEALFAKTTVGTGNSVASTIATRNAGAVVEVNVSNTVPVTTANVTYGLVVGFTGDSNTRQARPTAYIAFGEKQGSVVGSAKANGVSYLFDLGFAEGTSNTYYVNATGESAGANGAFRVNSCTTNAGCLAIRVNGVEKFIQLFSTLA
jgi:hypothetical protein